MSDVATVDHGRAQSGGDADGTSPAAAITQVAADTARTVREEFAGVVEDVRHQASDQFEHQRQTATKAMVDFAAAIRKAGDELAQNDQSLAAKMIKQAADGLEGVSRSLSDKKPEELLDAARHFGRENPVALGAAAVLAGLAVGRFLRSSEGHRPASGSPSSQIREPATQPWDASTSAADANPAAHGPTTSTAASSDTSPPVQTGAGPLERADATASPTAWRA